MRLTPSQCAEYQQEMREFTQSPVGHGYMHNFWNSEKQKALARDLSFLVGQSPEQRLGLEKIIMDGYTYWVNDDMIEVAKHAATSMPNEGLAEEDLPCQNGIMFFEHPLHSPDLHGKSCSIGAIGWMIGSGRGIVRSKDDPDVDLEVKKGEDMAVGRGCIVTWYSDRDDPADDYGRAAGLLNATFPCRFTLLGETLHLLDQNDKPGTDEGAAAKMGIPLERAHDMRFFLDTLPKAIWRLMQQQIAVISESRPDRPTRRRMEKAGVKKESTIRLVTLRRLKIREVPEGEAQPRDWTHRWMVSGHWRNVWLPSTKRHRLTWIAPFVKGPEHKPLVMKPTVRQLVR